eukprot:scaffold633_cov288-Ochromonas_danica.AAC.15
MLNSILFLFFVTLALLEVNSGFKSLLTSSRKGTNYHPSSRLFAQKIKVALTREAGANDKLAALLPEFECVELPCLTFETTPEASRIGPELAAHDAVILTSPQAVKVFLKEWNQHGRPPVKVITVGKGTSQPLKKEGIVPVFEPSEALGKVLAKELPLEIGKRLLYPSSALAADTLASGLEERGFQVTRLDTYTTVAASWSSCDVSKAQLVDIVTFGSPSTVEIWAEKLGITAGSNYDTPVVVIGPTSQRAAEAAGYRRVVSPEEGSKGLEAWANAVRRAAADL